MSRPTALRVHSPARAVWKAVSMACSAILALAAPASAQTVVELFTSQSCSSCPPAEAYFKDLAARKDLVVLEWHVDYWDDLRVGRSGAWKDPYSSPANTARQRAYNVALRGRGDVYTPQAVVGGRLEAVGSDRDRVADLIHRDKATRASTTITLKSGERPEFIVTGAPSGADIWLVSFRRQTRTEVGGGENHGRKLDSANVVTGFRRLNPASRYETPRLAEGEGCALLVQAKSVGPILAGAYCPHP